MGRIKLFIVDDEIMSIQYFKSILAQSGADYEIVGEAISGMDALNKIPAVRPDIIFVDISMPLMNGLELVSELKKSGMGYRFILLTSYRDFDYVKRGLELGVSGYLLKHELTAELLVCEVEKLMEAAKLDKLKSHSFTEHNLRMFLKSGLSDHSELAEEGRGERRFFLINAAEKTPLYISSAAREETPFNCDLLEEATFPDGIICRNAIRMDAGQWCGVFYLNGYWGEKQTREKLMDTALKTRAIFLASNISVALTCSDTTHDFYSLPGFYERFQAIEKRRFLRSDLSDIILLNEIASEDMGVFNYEARALQLWESINHMNTEYALQIICEIFTQSAAVCETAAYTEIVRDILKMMRRFCSANKIYLTQLEDDRELCFETNTDVSEWFALTLSQCIEMAEKRKNSQYPLKIVKAFEYIQEHYTDNMSVADIAEFVGLSDGHLRKLFKTEVKCGIVDYLTLYRVEKAKELMKTGNYRILDIYKLVGFSSSQYFSSVFKKAVGMSPIDYLKTLGQ